MLNLIRCVTVFFALLLFGEFAEAHDAVTRHSPHAAESHKAHAAVSRQPHAATSHASPQKPPKRQTAHNANPHQVAKH
jgi:hypothetical protein